MAIGFAVFLLGFDRFYPFLLCSTQFYWVLLGFTGLHWVWVSVTRFSVDVRSVYLIYMGLALFFIEFW